MKGGDVNGTVQSHALCCGDHCPCVEIDDKGVCIGEEHNTGTEKRLKLLDSHTNYECTHRSKNQALPASLEELPGLLPITNFGPA